MKKPRQPVLFAAFRYSIPVLLGYAAIGMAFGLLMSNAGYPWWLSVAMSVIMFAGAGQYIAVGLFAAGTTIWEAVIVQLVVNARHIAYGFSMLKRFDFSGPYKFYCIFGMTDETFALLSTLPEDEDGCIKVPGIAAPVPSGSRHRFMFLVTLLDQLYWITGTVIGAVVGRFIPFNMKGIGFALTALFTVLMIEQILKVRKPGIFIVSAIPAVLGIILLPSSMSLLAALALALVLSSLLGEKAGPG
jgi:4-azaleucine resistance transporter AzlC